MQNHQNGRIDGADRARGGRHRIVGFVAVLLTAAIMLVQLQAVAEAATVQGPATAPVLRTVGTTTTPTANRATAKSATQSATANRASAKTATSCSAAFAQLWAGAVSGTPFSYTGPLGTVNFATAQASGTCSPTSSFSWTGSFSLFGGQITATGLSGTVTNAGITVKTGSVNFPAAWRLSAIAIASTQPLVITFGATPAATTITGALTTPGLPLLSLPGVAVGNTTLTFANQGVGLATAVTIGSSSAVDLSATVDLTGNVAGSASVTGLSLLGQSVNLSGGFTYPAGGPLTSAIIGTIAGPVTVTGGLVVSGLSLTVGTAGLTVSGTAKVGTGATGTTETVAVTGTLTSLTTWSLAVTTPHPAAWSPLSGLTITPKLTGTITDTNGAVTYSLRASGSGGSPLASWAPVAGATISVAGIRLTNAGAGGHVVLTVTGKVTVGPVVAPVTGQVDLSTGAISLKASATSVTVSAAVTLTSVNLRVTGNGQKSSVTLAGSATAAINAAGVRQNVTATIRLLPSGALVIGGQADLSPWGLGGNSVGLAYWASAAVAKFQTGNPSVGNNGVIALPAGLSAEGTFTIPSAVAGFLSSQLGLTISAGDTVAVMASLGANGAFAFTATLGTPTGFPVLTLPAGITLGPTSVTFANSQAVIDTSATLSGNGGQATLHLALNTDGSFSGTASLQGLQVFGTTLSLTGTLSGDGHGGVTSQVSATLTQALAIAPGLTLNAGTTITLGTSGLAVSGAATFGTGPAAVTVSINGTLINLQNWSLAVSTASPVAWNPTPALHISASFAGTITDTAGSVTFAVMASGGAGSPLATWQPTPAVGLSIGSVTLSNGPSTAPGVNAGDVWVSLDAQATLNLPGASNTQIGGQGVLDLTSGAFSFTTQLDGAFSFTSSGVTLNGLQVTLTGNPAAGTWSVHAAVTLMASLPNGTNLTLPASISYQSGGAFVVAVSADLSSWLGAASDTHLFLATQAVKAYPTGDPALGKLNLPQGLSIAEDFTLPANIVTTLGAMGIPVPTTVLATAAIDLSQGSLTLSVTVGFGPGLKIFSVNGTSLVLIDGTLKVSVGESTAFSLSVDTTLNLPAMGADSQASSLNLSGSLSFSLTNESIDASLTITAGGPTGAWQPAFGIPGLSLNNLVVQGGISFGSPIPLPNLGFAATVNALPSPIANLLGYQQGAPITVALNINTDALLVDLSIGTPGGPVALEPLASVGSPSVIQISYAKLYLAAVPVTLGGTTYPAGFELSFSATVSGVPVSVVAQVDPNAFNITFDGSIGSFGVADFQVGGATLNFHVGSDGFRFEIDGSLSGETLGFAMSADLQLTSAGNFQLNIGVAQSTPWLALYTNLGGSFGNGSWYVTGTGAVTVANLGSVYAYLSMGSGTAFQAGITVDGNPYNILLPVSGFSYDFSSSISGSGSVTIVDGVLAFSGAFSGSLDLHLSTVDGFSATANVSVDAYVTTWQTDWCYWNGIPYPCGSSPVTNYLTSFTTSAGVDITSNQFVVYVDYGAGSYGIPMQF